MCKPGTGPAGGFEVDIAPVSGPWIPFTHDNAVMIEAGRHTAAGEECRGPPLSCSPTGTLTRAVLDIDEGEYSSDNGSLAEAFVPNQWFFDLVDDEESDGECESGPWSEPNAPHI
jgi:hypothetical protein